MMAEPPMIALPARRAAAADLAIIAAAELGGALLLGLFLLADDSRLIVALLMLLGGVFAALQLRPALEERIVAAFRRARPAALALGLGIVLVYPFTLQGSSYALHLLVVAQLYAVLALALNFQLGSANIPNFATGASYGIGAYSSALLAINFGVSFWLTLPVAALVATGFGFLLGFPSMRTRESYLALVTIAFGIVIHQLLNNFDWTGGPNGLVGIPAPSIAGHSFADPIEILGRRLPSQANFYYLAAALVALAIVSARRLHASRVGLAWNALRGDELAARCQGINVVWYKMLAFAVDAFLAAFAGSVYAAY
ncbi:MAG: branched-chain amino acid ABC transporter permease, partial [Thermomicrobiales bacterium]|nr:branched-chain amino acid ABC transporter permease [Thermomicrobiales bacterium]